MPSILIKIILFFSFSACLLGETLIIGRGDGEYTPYEWEEDGKFHGIHIDLVQKAASNLKIPIKFESFPWKRAVKLLKYGKIHGILFISKNPEREKFAKFLPGNVISVTKLKLFALKKNKSKLGYDGSLKSIEGKKIAIQKGYSYGKGFDSSEKIKKIPVKTKEQLLSFLLKRRAQYALVNKLELLFSMKRDPRLKEIIFLEPPINSGDVYLAFSKKAKVGNIPQQFAEEITKLKESGLYQKINQKYLGEEAN